MPLWLPLGDRHSSEPTNGGIRPAIWLFADQLSTESGPLAEPGPAAIDIFFVESLERARRIPFHRKKLSLSLSAARHFAREIAEAGGHVHYYREEANDATALADFASRRGTGRLLLLDHHDAARLAEAKRGAEEAGFEVEIVADPGGPVPFELFRAWSESAGRISSGKFVERFRSELGLAELPEPAPDESSSPTTPVPPLPIFPRDPITREVVAFVEANFDGHFGRVGGFNLPVTRDQVSELVDHLLFERLPLWATGNVQPRMRAREPFLCQSILDPYVGLGLVTAAELIRRTVRGTREGRIPLTAARLFLEKVVGGREYLKLLSRIRPEQVQPMDPFGHRESLPGFLRAEQSAMHCLEDTLKQIRDHGFAPNAQRTVLIGNLLLLCETDPAEVKSWYQAAFLDSRFCPVRPSFLTSPVPPEPAGTLPSVISPAREICDNSDYCTTCEFDPDTIADEHSCPFNVLYWDFLDRNREGVAPFPRLAAGLARFDAMPSALRDDIRKRGREIRLLFTEEKPSPVAATTKG